MLIAYDRDDAGERAAEKLAPHLIAEGPMGREMGKEAALELVAERDGLAL